MKELDQMSLEQKLEDALADGKISDEEAEVVRKFAEFVRIAGPVQGGDSRTPGQRLRDAGREDLRLWALGVSVCCSCGTAAEDGNELITDDEGSVFCEDCYTP